MNNLFDARASKKAEVDAELKEAISALRKPNRQVVSKAMAEADERRTSANLATKSNSTPPTCNMKNANKLFQNRKEHPRGAFRL